MLRAMPANGTLCPSFEPLEPRLLLNAQVVGPELLELGGQAPYLFEFSVDIGSDTELSDPNVDGDEGFDPGDVYAQNSGPVTPPAVPGGRDGFKDDFNIFWYDPWPDPPDPVPPPNPPMTAVPVGHGTEQDYYEYFDLDGHDQIDVMLEEYVDPNLPAPTSRRRGFRMTCPPTCGPYTLRRC